MKLRRPPVWWVVLVALGTIGGTIGLVTWADRDFVTSSARTSGPVTSTIRFAFQRSLHTAPFVAAGVTLGMALLLASTGRFWPQRGRRGPGALRVLTVGLLGGLGTVHLLLTASPIAFAQGTAVGLVNFWHYEEPGIAIGAWLVTRRVSRRWRRDPLDRAARMVSWLWLAEPLLIVLHALLFR